LEKQWGSLNRSSGTTDDKSNSGKFPSQGVALQENFELEQAYVTFATKIGQFQIGYQPTDEWGTVFADIPGGRPRAIFSTKFGPLNILALYEKMVEGDTVTPYNDTVRVAAGGAAQTANLTLGSGTPSGQTDRDFDRYMLAGIYNFKGGDAGLLYVYNTSAVPRALAVPYRIMVHRLSPYFKATFGPIYVEGEFVYDFGKARKYDNAGSPADVDKEGIGGYINAKYSIGPAYVGAQFGYSSGNDTTSQSNTVDSGGKDKAGPISSTAWTPTLFFMEANYKSYTYGTDYGGAGGTPTFSSNKQNFVLYSLYGGYNATSRLLFETALTLMDVATQPVGFQSKRLGTELDVKGTYKIFDNLTYMVGAGYLWTGDYFKGATNASTGNDYVVLNKLTLNF